MSPEDKDPRESGSREETAEPAAPAESSPDNGAGAESPPPETQTVERKAYYDDPYDDYDYQRDTPPTKALTKSGAAQPPPPPSGPTTDDEDSDDDGMVRMSFLEHLEELRTRIIRALIGMIAAYLAALAFAPDLFKVFVLPFQRAAAGLPYDPPLQLTQITPTEQFYLEYIKIPLLAAIFIGSPWLMYQAWAFISPGLYKRERRWAFPFIASTASLFIIGGLFCYFVALRFALSFLIGLAFDPGVRPMISLTSYYEMFFNLHVGLGLVFQMPIVIFFFTLLRITSPGFLLSNSRYAILVIFVLAAVITPTPDVTTMMTFAAPMILLFYVGIAVSYLIVMRREGKRFPWRKLLIGLLIAALVGAGGVVLLHERYGWEYTTRFPFIEPPL